MSPFRNTILPILLAFVWISLSEFARNEFLLKSYWVEHYESMGLTFPSEPVNGIV
jgi:ABC-type microcin C transport system permease subunit YejE